jgi:hypothetical protein
MNRRAFFGAIAASLVGQHRLTAWAERREVKRIVYRCLADAWFEQVESTVLYGNTGPRCFRYPFMTIPYNPAQSATPLSVL